LIHITLSKIVIINTQQDLNFNNLCCPAGALHLGKADSWKLHSPWQSTSSFGTARPHMPSICAHNRQQEEHAQCKASVGVMTVSWLGWQRQA
jgi:hypothetical protein